MKKFLYLLVLFGCASGGKMMHMDNFQEISVGNSLEELVNNQGAPYSINKLGDGSEEYEYIEKVALNNRIMNVRHYFFVIKEGKISAKRYTQEQPRRFRNSYELQTSRFDLDSDSTGDR